jgi:hypothetical protein
MNLSLCLVNIFHVRVTRAQGRRERRHIEMTTSIRGRADWRCAPIERREAMRAILAAVVALSVLAGFAGASYADSFPRDFWQQQERNLP